jgi:hypothetical protein
VYEVRHINDESFLLLLVAGISPAAIVLQTNQIFGKLNEVYHLSGITIPSFLVLHLFLGGGHAVA